MTWSTEITNDVCCGHFGGRYIDELSGASGPDFVECDEPNTCCGARIFGKKYNLSDVCFYYVEEESARKELGWSNDLFDLSMKAGSVAAFLLPSVNDSQNLRPDVPPTLSEYREMVKKTAEAGFKTLMVVAAIVVFLILKYVK